MVDQGRTVSASARDEGKRGLWSFVVKLPRKDASCAVLELDVFLITTSVRLSRCERATLGPISRRWAFRVGVQARETAGSESHSAYRFTAFSSSSRRGRELVLQLGLLDSTRFPSSLSSPPHLTMAPSPPPHPPPADPDSEEPIDLPSLQTALDDSFSLARSLVESWIPKDLDPSWDDTSTAGAGGVNELEKRERPARYVPLSLSLSCEREGGRTRCFSRRASRAESAR